MDPSMDIDGPEFILEVNEAVAAVRLKKAGDIRDTYFQQTSTPDCFQQVAVIDTNFMISNLTFLEQLVAQAEKQRDPVFIIVIPWTVIMELDGLKTAFRPHQKDQLNLLARNAIRFLESKLQQASPVVRGQRKDEIYNREDIQTARGDDSILDCCMYFRYHLEKPVLLLSNDRNLSVKAMIHHVNALSADNKSKMAELLSSVSKGLKGMQVEYNLPKTQTYNSNGHHDIIDEDEDMLDTENMIDEHQAVFSGVGVSSSRHATPKHEKPPLATVASRAHWINDYYRLGMDLKKK